MREIKFRAWDKTQRKMVEVGQITWANATDKSYMSLRYFTNRDDDILFCNDVELMQYTGLKDKNGKEIYEGDVLHCDGFWNLYAVWDEENARFAFLCTDWVVTQGHPIQPNISSYCIIGNIYENPELLGVNK
jgi:hypothetical protein